MATAAAAATEATARGKAQRSGLGTELHQFGLQLLGRCLVGCRLHILLEHFCCALDLRRQLLEHGHDAVASLWRQILAFEEGPDLLAEQEAAVLSGRQRK